MNYGVFQGWQVPKRMLLMGLLMISALSVNAQNLLRTYGNDAEHTGGFTSALLLNGQIITANSDRTIRIRSAQTGELQRTLFGHSNTVTHLRIIGNQMISTSLDNTVRMWNTADWSLAYSVTLPAGVSFVTINSDPSTFFVGLSNGRVFQLTINNGSTVTSWSAHTLSITGLIAIDDTLYTSSEDYRVKSWNTTTYTMILDFPGPGIFYAGLYFDGLFLYGYGFYYKTSGSKYFGTIRKWSLAGVLQNQYELQPLNSWSNSPTVMRIEVCQNRMFIGSDWGLQILNQSSVGLITRTIHGNARPQAIICDAANNVMYTASTDRIIRRWNMANWEFTWATRPAWGYSAVTATPSTVIAGRQDGLIIEYSRKTGQVLKEYNGNTNTVTRLVIVGSFLFTTSEDEYLRQWNLASGSLFRTYQFTQNGVRCIAFNDIYVFAGSGDTRQWNMNTGVWVRNLVNIGQAFDLFATGTSLFASSWNGVIKQINIDTGALIRSFTGHAPNVYAIWVRDGFLYSGGDDKNNHVWRISDGAVVATWSTPFPIGTMAARGDYLFVGLIGGGDSVIQYNMTSMQLIRTYENQRGNIGGIALEGSSLFSASTDGLVREIFVPELVVPPTPIAVTTPDLPNVAPTTYASTTQSAKNSRGSNAAPSSFLGGGMIYVPVVAGSIFFGSALAFIAARATNRSRSSTNTTKNRTSTADLTTESTAMLPTVTSLNSPQSIGSGYSAVSATSDASTTQLEYYALQAGMTTDQGKTTVLHDQDEIAIPAFLELEMGTGFKQGELIGRGGAGSIFRAEAVDKGLIERSMGTPLVMKTVSSAIETMHAKHRRAFFQELSLMWRFRHQDNFVHVYAYSTRPVTMVMKFYELGDLSYFIHGSSKAAEDFRYSKMVVTSLLRQLTAAISYMHFHGIVHCDIKPANVLLDVDRRHNLIAVLTDFGISQIVEQRGQAVAGFERADLKGASYAYSPPEALTRFKNRVQENDPDVWKSGDVYAIGICILHTLSRHAPWRYY